MTMPASTATPDTEPDYYALIGVPPTATQEEIRRVYGDRVRTAMDANDQPLFERLVAAFDVLKDDSRRAAYDYRRANTSPSLPMERTQMNPGGTTILPPTASDATLVLSSPTVMPGLGGERTTMFTGTPGQIPLPTVCAIGLSPCPLLGRAVLPDEGFCPECGVLLGAALGEAGTIVTLPSLRDETGREYPLRTGDNVVGRDGADVMLPDKSVSRRHARLSAAPGSLTLEDIGSTNGTKHKGTPVVANQPTPLYDGDMVQFGSVKLTVVVPSNGDFLALPAPTKGAAERTILPALAAPAGTNSAARLIAQDGTTYTLTGASTTFGRRAGNTVVLSGDSFVSGNHGAVTYENDGFRVVDLGSTNGSRLNGTKLAPNAPQVLRDGDEIMFGQTTFTFHGPG